MPSTLQYPLERQRDLQRRWGRLLQQTVALDKRLSPRLTVLPQAPRPSGAKAEPAKPHRLPAHGGPGESASDSEP